MDYGPICSLLLWRTTLPPPKLKVETGTTLCPGNRHTADNIGQMYRSRIHDIAQLKMHFIEKWENFNWTINWSSTKQSGSDAHVLACIWARREYFERVWLLHLTVTRLDVANNAHSMTLGKLSKLTVTFADVDESFWNFAISLGLDILWLSQNLVKIRHRLQ